MAWCIRGRCISGRCIGGGCIGDKCISPRCISVAGVSVAGVSVTDISNRRINCINAYWCVYVSVIDVSVHVGMCISTRNMIT